MKLRVTMPDGQYLIPIEVIAEDMKSEVGVNESEDYLQAILDHAPSMTWEYLSQFAVKIPIPAEEMESAWRCADGEIVEK